MTTEKTRNAAGTPERGGRRDRGEEEKIEEQTVSNACWKVHLRKVKQWTKNGGYQTHAIIHMATKEMIMEIWRVLRATTEDNEKIPFCFVSHRTK